MTVVDVELRDGSTVRVRPVRPGDVGALEAFLGELSPDARRYRFFGSVDLESAARAMASGGGPEDRGLVALTGVPERIIGHAQYMRDPGATRGRGGLRRRRRLPGARPRDPAAGPPRRARPRRRAWSCSTRR